MGVDGVAGTGDKDGRSFSICSAVKGKSPNPALAGPSMLGSASCEITVRMLRCWACCVTWPLGQAPAL